MAQVEVPKILVYQEPGQIPRDSLRGGVAIVIDVLRATTTMAYALAAGCREIIPCAEIEEARAVADCVPPGSILLAGERGGLPIEGFDLGNSPEEFTPEVCRDKTIVMTTSNGTRAILASLEADQVYVSSFANLTATVEDAVVLLLKKGRRHPIHIVCAGSEGKPAEEDTLFAGCLADQLIRRSYEALMSKNAWTVYEGEPADELSDFDAYESLVLQGDEPSEETAEAVEAWRRVMTLLHERPLLELLLSTEGGERLRRIGRTIDIEAAAKFDSRGVVGKLGRKPTRISAV